MRRILMLLSVAATLPPITGCAGQRLLHATVEQDGKLVLKTMFGVKDSKSPAEAWRELTGKKFKAEGSITPEAGDPQKAVLRGKVRIELKHGATPFAAAEVAELTVVKVAGTEEWQIPESEIERAGKGAGY